MAVETSHPVALGALLPGTARSAVVVSALGELAVALREHVAPHEALIRDVRPDEVALAIAACRPFPWMVAGEGPAPPSLVHAARRHPIVILWRVPVPAALPPHARGFASFVELAREVRRGLSAAVCGMRLAPGEGVQLPGGRCVATAELQALITVSPGGFQLPASRFRPAARMLSRHAIEATVHRDARGGHMVLG